MSNHSNIVYLENLVYFGYFQFTSFNYPCMLQTSCPGFSLPAAKTLVLVGHMLSVKFLSCAGVYE